MSDGCVAMQAALAPSMAWMRFTPPDGTAPRTRRAFIAGRTDVVEIVAARALIEVAAIGGDVAQLRAPPRLGSWRRAGGSVRRPGGCRAVSALLTKRAQPQTHLRARS